MIYAIQLVKIELINSLLAPPSASGSVWFVS